MLVHSFFPRMLKLQYYFYKLYNFHYSKFLCALVVVLALDYFGIFLQFCELNFDKQFHIFLRDDSTTEQVISNLNYIHNPLEKCTEKELALVFLIKSAIHHGNRRAVIRQTWGNEQRFPHVNIRTVFLLGHPEQAHMTDNINMEVAQHKDIVQADFLDTYFNNTLKTLMGMRWAKEHCPNAKFYMVVDDDYYISTKNLIRFVAHPGCYPAQQGIFGYDEIYKELYAGYVFQSRPLRHKGSKWFVSLPEYPFNKWPPYVTAGAFILSQNSLRKMFKTCLKTRLFRFDDIYLSIVAYKAAINLTHCHLFDPYTTPDYRYAVAAHGYDDPEQLERIWKQNRAAGFA